MDFGYLLVFDFGKCKYWQLHIFFPPNLHAPCTPRYRFCFCFVIGFNFIGLFSLSLLDFCTCYFCFTLWLSVSLASLSYFNISKSCVCSLFQFLCIFYFSFWVLCSSQCHSWNDSVWASYYSIWASASSLWSSWIFGVSLTFNLPMI